VYEHAAEETSVHEETRTVSCRLATSVLAYSLLPDSLLVCMLAAVAAAGYSILAAAAGSQSPYTWAWPPARREQTAATRSSMP
jgi:hypothetical protein